MNKIGKADNWKDDDKVENRWRMNPLKIEATKEVE